jgi:hypothetical protein
MSRHVARVQKGCGPVFVLFGLLVGVFFGLVAWCAFGWPGLVGVVVVAVLAGVVTRSERARLRRVRERAEAELVRCAAEVVVSSPCRFARGHGRGGVR